MEYKQLLINYILNSEAGNATAFLEKIRKDSSCVEYTVAREKVLLVETVKSLNDTSAHFYMDADEFAKKLFEEDFSTDEAIECLCDAVRQSVKKNRQSSFLKAKSYVEEQFTDSQLTIGAVADYIGVNHSMLTRLFSENIKITPGEYIGKLRVDASISFLKNNLSVEKTAGKVGFSSVESYIRAFKKHMGMTPGMWKKKNL